MPDSHLEPVSEALAQSGAGRFERYDRCSFRTRGVGAFRGIDDSDPFVGIPGQDERSEEWRLEVALPLRLWPRIEAALLEAHPYDEPAYDLYPLLNGTMGVGDGDRKSTRLNSSHIQKSRMPSSA